ncbi:class I SAM-dependent methyltransferase [Campylobacter curvus]|uniref:class I SAM-dependent methyltransferase n=1 Tax=Campylobacter curvus TaxID=200 RepID=UPI00146FE30E|nr:class I SAM-dependent methyltransferase [Campylobacter curvus]
MQGLLNWEAIRELRFADLSDASGRVNRINWDDVADMYNEMVKIERDFTLKQVEILPITSADSVADIGCGTGRMSVPIARIAKSVTAVDAFARMLHHCETNAKEAGVKNIKFLKKSWLDDDATEVIGRHDVVIASRSLGLGDIKKLNKIARKFVCLICFLDDEPSLRQIQLDLLDGVAQDAPKTSGKDAVKNARQETRKNNRMFGYNVTFNMLYDMGANVNVRVLDDGYEAVFASKEEAYAHFKFAGDVPAKREKIYRANVDKYLQKFEGGYRFFRPTKSYVMWWDARELADRAGW